VSSTRVFIVRHGATVASAEDRFAGESDVPLSDTGRDQARGLARRLASEPIVAAYASHLSRAVETARIVAEPHGLPVTERPELREISHGHWEGRTRADVEARFADEYAAWTQDPYTFAPRGGETGLAVTARALPAIRAILNEHTGGHVLVVSHKATIRLLISSILGFDPRAYRDRLDMSPACLTIVDFRDTGHARLALYNDVSHYADAPAGLPPIPSRRLSKHWGER